MADWHPSNCGQRIASETRENVGYFFTSLDFITEEHLAQGLFIGGRQSRLLVKSEVQMRSPQSGIDPSVAIMIDDCDTQKGSPYCGIELIAAKKLGHSSFLRYMNAFCPGDVLHIYKVQDV